MSYSQLNLEEAAAYLHLDPNRVEKLARQGDLEVRYVRGKLMFSKQELHDWMSQKLLGEKIDSKNHFHNQISELDNEDFEHDKPFLSSFLDPKTMSPDLSAKTRSSLLRELVSLAVKNDLVTDEGELLTLVEEREGLCSTGLVNGVALPHSRIHSEYLILDSFIVIAHVPGGIPFGSQDGDLTDLFLMPCAHNDRIHLHMIARIALLLHKTDLADEIRACDTADAMGECVRVVEHDFFKISLQVFR